MFKHFRSRDQYGRHAHVNKLRDGLKPGYVELGTTHIVQMITFG